MSQLLSFSELQIEAIELARAIVEFVKANPYQLNHEAVAKYREQYGENGKLVWRNSAGQLLGRQTETPSVGLYLDNSEWMREFARKYSETFAERVEAIRLKFVEAEAVPEMEMWYTKAFMTDIRMRQLAAYLVSAAFMLDGIELSPNVQGTWFKNFRSAIKLD